MCDCKSSFLEKCIAGVREIASMIPAQPGTLAIVRTPESEWSVPVIAWVLQKIYGVDNPYDPYVNNSVEPVVLTPDGADPISFYLADFSGAKFVGIKMANGLTSMDETEHKPGTILPL